MATPQYSTKLFYQVWETSSEFWEDYNANPLKVITQANCEILFALLYARYGNNPIANYDENQFKMKVFSIMFQYGPTWEKRLDIQSKLRALTDAEITSGSRVIYNHAFNPGSSPSTSTLEELTQINDQNTTNFKKSKIEGYAALWDLLETNVTGDFINKFSVCFKQFVEPEDPILYESEEEE